MRKRTICTRHISRKIDFIGLKHSAWHRHRETIKNENERGICSSHITSSKIDFAELLHVTTRIFSRTCRQKLCHQRYLSIWVFHRLQHIFHKSLCKQHGVPPREIGFPPHILLSSSTKSCCAPKRKIVFSQGFNACCCECAVCSRHDGP